MASHAEALLAAAEALIARGAGKKGRQSQARIRRSISTTYYAVFSFLIEEATNRIVGTRNALRRRRRTLARCFDHSGMKTALLKVSGNHVDVSIETLMSPSGIGPFPLATPAFGRKMARAFCDAQAKRHDADYDMNEPLSQVDAELLLLRAREAIESWNAAASAADRDFKHALYLLMMLKGQIRRG